MPTKSSNKVVPLRENMYSVVIRKERWILASVGKRPIPIGHVLTFLLARSGINWGSRPSPGKRNTYEDTKRITQLSNNFRTLFDRDTANVIVDLKRKEELSQDKIPEDGITLKEDMWHFTCAGQGITGDMENRLRYDIQELDATLWWSTKLRIPEEYHHQLSWKVYQWWYRKSTPRWLHIWSVKFGADILPTRKNLVRRRHNKHYEFPCCGEPNETASYLFLCQDDKMIKPFEDEIDLRYNHLLNCFNNILPQSRQWISLRLTNKFTHVPNAFQS